MTPFAPGTMALAGLLATRIGGALLILGPAFLYLRDNFGYRIITIFKFYYQAWIVLSLAARLICRIRGFRLPFTTPWY